MNGWAVFGRAAAVGIVVVATAGGVSWATSGPDAAAPTGRAATSIPHRIISIVPQGTYADQQIAPGPVLSRDTTSQVWAGFVIPPDRGARTQPLKMRVVYLEYSAGACSWVESAGGLAGPDAPETEVNIHEGIWRAPGDTDGEGLITVPAGKGSAHSVVFTWPSRAEPGMFVEFVLERDGADPADTCDEVIITGMELRY